MVDGDACVFIVVYFFISPGQLPSQVRRHPFCEPAVVHPCPVHGHTTLPQGQDEKTGETVVACTVGVREKCLDVVKVGETFGGCSFMVHSE